MTVETFLWVNFEEKNFSQYSTKREHTQDAHEHTGHYIERSDVRPV